MFTLQTSFKPPLVKGGGVTFIEVTVNSKVKNSEDFCPNYVHEFGLYSLTHSPYLDLFIHDVLFTGIKRIYS
jgi:hypothetical protein